MEQSAEHSLSGAQANVADVGAWASLSGPAQEPFDPATLRPYEPALQMVTLADRADRASAEPFDPAEFRHYGQTALQMAALSEGAMVGFDRRRAALNKRASRTT